MKLTVRVWIGVAATACGGAGLVWMFVGDSATAAQIGNSNVLSAVVAVCTVVVAVLQARPSKRDSDLIGAEERLQAAVEYLAWEMLGYWQRQAKARGITTACGITTAAPMAVRWRWASEDVAVTSRA